MTTPTDEELFEVIREAARGGAVRRDGSTSLRIVRAVLAKWGTPVPVGAEPLAYLHDDGYWTAAKNDAGRRLNDRLLFAGSPKVAVYTTPQPTQAVRPAGWEPEFDQFLSDVMTAAGLVTHGKQCKQLGERLGAAVMKLRVHGIKGGQHVE